MTDTKRLTPEAQAALDRAKEKHRKEPELPAAHKIIKGIEEAMRGDLARVMINGQTWTRQRQCSACGAKSEEWWNYCAMCGHHIASGT